MNFETIKQMLFGDDRGVSPVIGVILMVAITVILAAVIGTFVLGLGENVQSQAPQASLNFQDANTDYAYSSPASPVDAFTIEHSGGEDLDPANLVIQVRFADDNALEAKYEDGSWSDDSGSVDVTSAVNGGNALGSYNLVATGDRITIQDDTTTQIFADNTQYKITVLDKDSGQTIASGTVTLR